jgi:hypothetical protein
MILKQFQIAQGLWLQTFCTLFLNKGQASYNLAPSSYTGFSHCATSYVQTTLAAAAASGDAAISLTDATGMTDNGYLGIANDSGVIEWFTATFVGSAATISGTMSDDAALGNVVYFHTVASQINRPTRIMAASRRYASGQEIPLDPPVISRTDYMAIPNKTVTSKIVNLYYDPQLVSGVLYVWPTADTPNDQLFLSVDRPIQDVVNDEETYDLPPEWGLFLSDAVAVEIAPEYGLPIADRQVIEARYEKKLASLLSYDRDKASTYFELDSRR